MGKLIDLTGRRFGRLAVVCKAAPSAYSSKWVCECDCGSLITTDGAGLRYGRTKSCGCLKKENATAIAHARALPHKQSPLYSVWHDMKARCANPNRDFYEIYGARGIKVCSEWSDDFEAFYAWAVENGWKPGLTVDRIDNERGYEPGNCRIVTQREQIRNRRMTVCVEFNGESKPLAQWADELDIPYATLYYRLYRAGWSVEKALTKEAERNE